MTITAAPGYPNFQPTWPLTTTGQNDGWLDGWMAGWLVGLETHEWNAKPVGPFSLLLIFHLLCTYFTQSSVCFVVFPSFSLLAASLLPTVTLQGFLCWPSWPAYVWQLPSVYCVFLRASGVAFLPLQRLAALLAINPQCRSHITIYHTDVFPSTRLPPVMTLNELYASCSGPGLSFLCFCRHCQCKNLSSCAVFCCLLFFFLVNCRRKCSGSGELVNCRLA